MSWRDEPLPLNRKTFDLLLYLVDHADRVVEKDELLRALWPESFVEESNLTQHIFLLRKALSRHESGTKIIETVPGRGYRFAAVIHSVETEQRAAADRMVISASESFTRITLEEEIETSEPAAQEFATEQPLLPLPSPKRRIYWITGAAVVAAALSLIGWFGWQYWLDRTSGSPVDLVLTAMDGTTGDAVLDRALVDVLRMDLAQSPFVTVVPSSKVRATLTQMRHQPDDPVTLAMSREICERTNSQAVLHGTIARVDRHFLLTEEATSCVNGAIRAEAKQEAENSEALPHSIDKLAANLRQKLGESRRSVARFDKALFAQNTVSLEALKDCSQAVHDYEQGNLPEAVELNKRAIAADPAFGAAFFNMAAYYFTSADDVNGKAAILKAYSLRESVTEPLRFAISAIYNTATTQNLFETQRICQNWAELYPHSLNAWNLLSNTERDLGKVSEAEAHGATASSLWSDNLGNVSNLAVMQMHNGDLIAARATLDHAIAHKMDGDLIRNDYLELAYLLHDSALLHTLRAWAADHPEAGWFLITDAGIAIAEGRFSDARKLIARAASAFRQMELPAVADARSRSAGRVLLDTGDMQEGKTLLHSSPIDPESFDDIVGLVQTGDLTAARASLRAWQTKYPQGTLLNLYWGPRIQAGIALALHQSNDAIAMMEPTRQFDKREDLSIPRFRADLFLIAGQPKIAEKEYRGILAHQEVDPTSVAIPLSWLGLGRALAAEGNRATAIDAYQQFLTLWSHADPDAIYLKQAKQELAALQKGAPAK